MATNKKSTRSTQTKKNTSKKPQTRKKTGRQYQSEPIDSKLTLELIGLILVVFCVVLFLSNFGLMGTVGKTFKAFQFGLWGVMAYVAPILFLFAVFFGYINQQSGAAIRKLVCGIVIFLLCTMFFEVISGHLKEVSEFEAGLFYRYSAENFKGGGFFGGMLAYIANKYLSIPGTILLILVLLAICIMLITEKSLVEGAREGGRKIMEASRESSAASREEMERRRQESLQRRRRKEIEAQEKRNKRREIEDEKARKLEEEENEKILRMERKKRGVMMDTSLDSEKEEANKAQDDMHEILVNIDSYGADEDLMTPEFDSDSQQITTDIPPKPYNDTPAGRVKSESRDAGIDEVQPIKKDAIDPVDPDLYDLPEPVTEFSPRKNSGAITSDSEQPGQRIVSTKTEPPKKPLLKPKKYQFPPISLLNKPAPKSNNDNSRELKETAARLRQTLETFGVKVTVTEISQGPSVTRFELQPDVGVKVSKIVGLADDIKLNLAATDIRIEAPIRGKSAVGIEVPNKENAAVSFRELIESKEYTGFQSNLSFAVGKDIGGQVIVTDISKMPHMLIAGATGSGKSVCINTIIMSILYKAHPDDVKLIMIDPKVVELSVYNGIPHLLLPVVTDPKKAAGALHWGVAEMTERYNKFAEMNVRDLKGYNQKAEQMIKQGNPDAPAKMPQVVIIVDELADLMMVCPGEVEESICRLAQLARAAGIHLVIATQRPSVDVITGLIKANMPSRVAFAVSSGVDSRTILDMNGAEKLLGKGDMLFYPQGYPRPARIQGAFISDDEVQDVVNFLKEQQVISAYNPDVEGAIKEAGAGSGTSGGGSFASSGPEIDDLFVQAGQIIIDKDKASIGMLQRVLKIGFNRAARIMDQLCEAGVVGEEEGTKPRKVLMTPEQFENYVEEYL